MARRNRETLKNYFKNGRCPGEQEFEDLIDSTLNTLDDGYSGSSQTGLELTPQSSKGTVISLYRNPEDTKAIWEIAVDKDNSDLQIKRVEDEDKSEPIIRLKYKKKHHEAPEISINGIVNSKGRKNEFKKGSVPADGNWHDMFDRDDKIEAGCWAFEIVAACGERHKGRYAMVVAKALQCYGGKPKVHSTGARFGYWGNKIKIRWKNIKGENRAILQIKTSTRYGAEVKINYQIGSLWDNPYME